MSERLRQWLIQIGGQLSVLSVSQRLAIGLCAAMAAGSLLWLFQWSTTPELTLLVSHDFSYDDLDAAEGTLKANGIPHEIRGTRIFVRSGDRHNVLRLLHTADALPEGSFFDMDAVVSDSNPFQSPEARQFAQNYAKGNELAKIIATSAAVKSASVIINPITKRRLGGTTDVPTASVTVTLASGREMSNEIVESLAKLVAGGVAGLRPHNVSITDARTMRHHSLPHPDDAASFDVLGMIKQREEHYRTKILSKFMDIPGIQVAVTVELDTSKRVIQNVKHDMPQPKSEKSNSTEQSSASQPSEAGVQANLGQALTATAQGQTNTSEETTIENYEPLLSQTETIEQMPFSAKRVTAVVGLPRSFVVGVYRAQYPDVDEDPREDDPNYVAVRESQVARVRGGVERIVQAIDPDDVEVDVYPDIGWSADGGSWSRVPGGVAFAGNGEEQFAAMDLVLDYGPQLGLGTLALMSLFMMTRMVKKSSDALGPRRKRLSETVDEVEEELLSVGVPPVGKAETTEGLLTGQEVDPATLRHQELAQEVSAMVKGDPEGTASLLRRWIDNT